MKKKIVIGENAKLSVKDLAEMVDMCNRFSADMRIGTENAMINAKSFMGVMAIGLVNGREVYVEASGADETEALRTLESFLV